MLLFGPLRSIEVEHSYERVWYSITEVCMVMPLFRDEFDAKFLGLFTILLTFKLFHWISQDRVEFMEQSPSISVTFHLRMWFAMALMLATDILFTVYSVLYTVKNGPSMMILFGFEYSILTVVWLDVFIKYTMHSIDLMRAEPWENKSMYIFYIELVIDFIKLLLYLGFFLIIFNIYGLPLHIIRDLIFTFRSFRRRYNDVIQYRRATQNMNERYPDATPEQLAQTDRICIICREEMEVAKRLPCGHLFHFRCLRSWLERQQTCPTCRSNVLVATPPPTTALANNIPGQQQRQQQQQQPQPQAPANIPPHLQQLWNTIAAQQQQQQQPRQPGTSAPVNPFPGYSSSATITSGTTVIPSPEPQVLGMYPLFSPSFPGTPVTPALDQIPLEQLQQLEGNERQNIEAKIRFLQGIQQQITGIIVQLSQYQQITADAPPPPPARSPSTAATSESTAASSSSSTANNSTPVNQASTSTSTSSS